MLWNLKTTLIEEPFASEADLENSICAASSALFGPNRVYLNL